MSPIRLVTFDVTGTLLTFRSPVTHQYAKLAAKYQIATDPQRLQTNFKEAWRTWSASHSNFGARTGLGWRGWWRGVVRQTFHDHDDVKCVGALADDLIDHFTTADAWSVVQGGPHLLTSLTEQGFKLGVISNFDPRLHTILRNLELSQYFSFILTSYEAGWAKPDEEIFVCALRAGQVREACEALHVGNDERLDYEGARKAGLQSVLVGTSPALRFPQVVDTVADVHKAITLINSGKLQ